MMAINLTCSENCTTNEYFCPLLGRCLNESEPCSLEKLVKWAEKGNSTFGPYGETCNTNETYCLAQWKCLDENEPCQGTTSQSLLDSLFCHTDSQFCKNSMECVRREGNDSNVCEPVNQADSKLDLSCVDDFGTGQ